MSNATIAIDRSIAGPAFSYQKTTNSKQRSNMTDEHPQDCLKLTLTHYSPDFHQIVDEMQVKTQDKSILSMNVAFTTIYHVSCYFYKYFCLKRGATIGASGRSLAVLTLKSRS
jgi:hypothetical protein